MVIGGAYRPIMHDRLNLLGRYTYLEDQAPSGQEDSGADIVEENDGLVITGKEFLNGGQVDS